MGWSRRTWIISMTPFVSLAGCNNLIQPDLTLRDLLIKNEHSKNHKVSFYVYPSSNGETADYSGEAVLKLNETVGANKRKLIRDAISKDGDFGFVATVDDNGVHEEKRLCCFSFNKQKSTGVSLVVEILSHRKLQLGPNYETY